MGSGEEGVRLDCVSRGPSFFIETQHKNVYLFMYPKIKTANKTPYTVFIKLGLSVLKIEV